MCAGGLRRATSIGFGKEPLGPTLSAGPQVGGGPRGPRRAGRLFSAQIAENAERGGVNSIEGHIASVDSWIIARAPVIIDDEGISRTYGAFVCRKPRATEVIAARLYSEMSLRNTRGFFE